MKIAVIGVGAMGKRHIEVAQSLDMDIVAICDLNQNALSSAGQTYKIPEAKQFLDINHLLEKVQLDCIVISTTAPSHCHLTLLAANAGIPYILREKPMATSLAECNQMIAVCEKQGSRLAVNHHMRFLDRFTFILEQLEQEYFGGLESINVISGNMGLVNNGCHFIDIFTFLANESMESVVAWFSKEKIANPRGEQYEDYAGSMRLSLDSGKQLFINAQAQQGHGLNIIVAGKYGQLYMDYVSGYVYGIHRNLSDLNLPTTRYATPSEKFTEQLKPLNILDSTSRLLSALINNEAVPDAYAARNTIETLVAAYQSNENNHQEIKLREAVLDQNRVFSWA